MTNHILRTIVLVASIALTQCSNSSTPPTLDTYTTIYINSSDGIRIAADVYEVADTNAPVILLFHQAGYSRGEYREIAPALNELGYACIAIDQRSGEAVNGVENEAYKQAEEKGLSTTYPDALPDLRATVDYALEEYEGRKLIIWGSSYSSSLVFILGSEYKEKISGILSFSPGEYFEYEGNSVAHYASSVECPVFITSAKNEHESWEGIFEVIPSMAKRSFLPVFEGQHGSKALWKVNEGSDAYWKEVTEFLKSISG